MMNNKATSEDSLQSSHILFALHALKEYEVKFGKDGLKKFLEKCPDFHIKESEKKEGELKDFNKKKEQEKQDTNKIFFMAWVISLEKTSQDRIFRELMWKIYHSEMLESYFEKQFSHDKFEKRMQEIMANLLQQQEEKARLLKMYLDFITHLQNQITQEINSLISIRESLLQSLQANETLIRVITQDALTAIIQLYTELPPMADPALEQLRNQVIKEANNYLNNPQKPVEDFFQYLSTHDESISKYLHDPENNYSSDVITKFDSVNKSKKETVSYISILREKTAQIKAEISNIDSIIEKQNTVIDKLEQKKENPSCDINKVKSILKERSNINQNVIKNTRRLFKKQKQQNKENTDQLQKIVNLNPDLTSKIKPVIDINNEATRKLETETAVDLDSTKEIRAIRKNNPFLSDDDNDLEKNDTGGNNNNPSLSNGPS